MTDVSSQEIEGDDSYNSIVSTNVPQEKEIVTGSLPITLN